MNIMQYFTKAGLEKYIKDNNITHIVAEPTFDNQLFGMAKEVIYFSADEFSKKHNDELGRKKNAKRGENPISPSQALKSKLDELNVEDVKTVARISDKSTKLGGKGKELEGIHRLLYTPPC